MAKACVLLFVFFSFVCYVRSATMCGIRHEQYTNHYVPFCELTCERPYVSSMCYNHRGSPGCTCKPGFYRDRHRNCIPFSQCNIDKTRPSLVCTGPNEKYTNNYMPKCEPSCNRPVNNLCAYWSKKSGCTCKGGFYRNEAQRCVRREECYQNPGHYPQPNSYYPVVNRYNPHTIIVGSKAPQH